MLRAEAFVFLVQFLLLYGLQDVRCLLVCRWLELCVLFDVLLLAMDFKPPLYCSDHFLQRHNLFFFCWKMESLVLSPFDGEEIHSQHGSAVALKQSQQNNQCFARPVDFRPFPSDCTFWGPMSQGRR
jgi:hypothetical protein